MDRETEAQGCEGLSKSHGALGSFESQATALAASGPLPVCQMGLGLIPKVHLPLLCPPEPRALLPQDSLLCGELSSRRELHGWASQAQWVLGTQSPEGAREGKEGAELQLQCRALYLHLGLWYQHHCPPSRNR